jgi:hypothetical protein
VPVLARFCAARLERLLFEAVTIRVCPFQFIQICFLANRAHDLLLAIHEVHDVVQALFARQLLFKVASLLNVVQAPQMIQGVFAVPDYLTRATFAPIFWVKTRTTGDVTGSLPRVQVYFCVPFAATTFILPRFMLRHGKSAF